MVAFPESEPEEYQRVRQEKIVNELYGGNDSLSLERKLTILDKAIGSKGRCCWGATNAEGKSIGGALEGSVATGEFEYLFNTGAITAELC